MTTYALVMAGGKGTRFWPESTSIRPKQYLSLLGGESLLSETLKRFDSLVEINNRFIVTVQEQELLVKECAGRKIDQNHIVFEPFGKNTAPCILLSLARLLKKGAQPYDVVIIVPSDHVIFNHREFQKTLGKSIEIVKRKSAIVTVGIVPTFPQTGYGHIRRGIQDKSKDFFKVDAFVEKPDLETAKNYLASGEYYWNAGIFVGTIKTFCQSYQEHAPDMYQYFDDLCEYALNFEKLQEIYEKMPEDSIDYAIMEKSDHILVVPSTFDWNDLGSWEALESVIQKENHNTVAKAKGAYLDHARGNIVYAPEKFVALVNVDDLIVVSNEHSIMVLPKKDSQAVKKVVAFLKDKKDFSDLV